MTQPLKPEVERHSARWLLTKIRPQARKTLPAKEALENLAKSVLVRQLHPLLLYRKEPDEYLLDGECRVRGLMVVAPDAEVDVLVVRRELEKGEAAILQIAGGIHCNTIPPIDQAVTCNEWLASNEGATATELADKLCISKGYLSKLLSLFKTVPAVQNAAAEGRLSPVAWHQLSQLAAEAQEGVLAMFLSGMAPEQVVDHCKKLRKATPEGGTARPQSRVTCPLAGGVRVVVSSGAGMDLPTYVEHLQAALEAARKAARENLDLPSAMKVWSCKAKAV